MPLHLQSVHISTPNNDKTCQVSSIPLQTVLSPTVGSDCNADADDDHVPRRAQCELLSPESTPNNEHNQGHRSLSCPGEERGLINFDSERCGNAEILKSPSPPYMHTFSI